MGFLPAFGSFWLWRPDATQQEMMCFKDWNSRCLYTNRWSHALLYSVTSWAYSCSYALTCESSKHSMKYSRDWSFRLRLSLGRTLFNWNLGLKWRWVSNFYLLLANGKQKKKKEALFDFHSSRKHAMGCCNWHKQFITEWKCEELRSWFRRSFSSKVFVGTIGLVCFYFFEISEKWPLFCENCFWFIFSIMCVHCIWYCVVYKHSYEKIVRVETVPCYLPSTL